MRNGLALAGMTATATCARLPRGPTPHTEPEGGSIGCARESGSACPGAPSDSAETCVDRLWPHSLSHRWSLRVIEVARSARMCVMDESDWLAERFEEQRTHLRAVAYRMLGSLTEVDDALQDTWVRVSRAETSEERGRVD